MTNEEKDKKEYELAVLVKDENDLAGIRTLLSRHGAEDISEPRAKRLGLAYEIKGITEAVFASMTFKAFGDGVKELEHDLGVRPDVVRSLVIKVPPVSTRPLPVGVLPEAPRPRPARPAFPSESRPDRPAPPRPLSNEALEKKIEEILG